MIFGNDFALDEYGAAGCKTVVFAVKNRTPSLHLPVSNIMYSVVLYLV